MPEKNKGMILHFLMTRFPEYKIDVKQVSSRNTRFLLSDGFGATAYCDLDNRLLNASTLSSREVETILSNRWKVLRPTVFSRA